MIDKAEILNELCASNQQSKLKTKYDERINQ